MRLTLEPLRVAHAAEMVEVLGDESLYTFTGGRPVTLAELEARYARQSVGRSADGAQGWVNWIVRERATRRAIGYVQATLTRDAERTRAQLAWVIAAERQGHGYAIEAAAAMVVWLRGHGVDVLAADIHPAHRASIGVARRLGLAPCPAGPGPGAWHRDLARGDTRPAG